MHRESCWLGKGKSCSNRSLLIAIARVIVGATANAAPFVVTNADFIDGIYDFHFYNEPTSRTVINGVDQGISDPTLSNSGWVCCRDDGPRYWHAQGPDFG